VLVDNADPYADGAADAIPAAVGRLARQGARIALLDCMGYTESSHEAAAARAGIPVLLARSVVGRLAGELLSATAGR
jgi:protein AroM